MPFEMFYHLHVVQQPRRTTYDGKAYQGATPIPLPIVVSHKVKVTFEIFVTERWEQFLELVICWVF